MIYLLILSGVFIAAGLFLLLANALKIPYLKTSKAVMNTGREDKKLSKTVEAIMLGIAARLGQLISMDKYKRTRLESTLKSAGIKMTPETFTAHALVKALAIGLLAIPCGFVIPLAIPFIVILAVAVYFRETGKADEKMREKREPIEAEDENDALELNEDSPEETVELPENAEVIQQDFPEQTTTAATTPPTPPEITDEAVLTNPDVPPEYAPEQTTVTDTSDEQPADTPQHGEKKDGKIYINGFRKQDEHYRKHR